MSGEAGGGYFYPDSEDECYDDDPSCTWCGGEMYVECDDPLQCLASDCDQRTHRCPACNGTGLSKNQWVWLEMAPTRSRSRDGRGAEVAT